MRKGNSTTHEGYDPNGLLAAVIAKKRLKNVADVRKFLGGAA